MDTPFKPFILNSTSIGQEGLDFHWYCNRVVHWNLPSNPIDIEQREGRVNRYRSLVVRRQAVEFADVKGVTFEKGDENRDQWENLFSEIACLFDGHSSDLV